MTKMTPWFEGTIPPARSGVYELKPHRVVPTKFAYFNHVSHIWYVGSDTPEKALTYSDRPYMVSCATHPALRAEACWQWRGFTEKQA